MGTGVDKKIRKLSDDELESASGGKELKDEKITEAYCKTCKKWVPVKMFTGMRYISSCEHNVEYDGLLFHDSILCK